MQTCRVDVTPAKVSSMLSAGPVGVTAKVERYWRTLDEILERTSYRPFVLDVRGDETEIGTHPDEDNPKCILVPTRFCFDYPVGTNGRWI